MKIKENLTSIRKMSDFAALKEDEIKLDFDKIWEMNNHDSFWTDPSMTLSWCEKCKHAGH